MVYGFPVFVPAPGGFGLHGDLCIADVWNALSIGPPGASKQARRKLPINDIMGRMYLCNRESRRVAQPLWRESLRILWVSHNGRTYFRVGGL
jgi:hypothetical protein